MDRLLSQCLSFRGIQMCNSCLTQPDACDCVSNTITLPRHALLSKCFPVNGNSVLDHTQPRCGFPHFILFEVLSCKIDHEGPNNGGLQA